MAGETKEKIMEAALNLFAKKGYLGASMSDIARHLGISKAALYKHYDSKQQILECIVKRMNELDLERAVEYGMPEEKPDSAVAAYQKTPMEKIRQYSRVQFLHWTEESFSSSFRKMLTLEQYRDENMARLYQNYLASGPTQYMAAIFRGMTDSDETAMQLALEFYGPMFLLYSVYDDAECKEKTVELLDAHVDRFIERMERERKGEEKR